MTDEEKSKELTRSSFAAQMAMLGYEPDGNPKDMVEVVRCKDCKFAEKTGFCRPKEDEYKCTLSEFEGLYDYHDENWFCADGKLS